jgi:hypothetical protein
MNQCVANELVLLYSETLIRVSPSSAQTCHARVLRDRGQHFTNCGKQFFVWWERRSLQTMLDMSQERSRMVGNQVSTVFGKPQSVYYEKSLIISSYVRSCIVCMNNVFSPIDLSPERNQCHGTINTGVLGVKSLPFARTSSQWNPNGFRAIASCIFGS